MNLRIEIDLTPKEQEIWIKLAGKLGIPSHKSTPTKGLVPVDTKTRIKNTMQFVLSKSESVLNAVDNNYIKP